MIVPVLLAAGSSTRMGAVNKLLLPIDGEPMVRRVAKVCAEATGRTVHIVLGYESAKVRAALDGLNTNFVVNPDHASGQVSSVRCGLATAPEGAVLLALGDQPGLSIPDLNALIDAHEKGCGDRITVPVPVDAEGRGNPIVIPATMRRTIMDGGPRLGCRRLTRDRPDLVRMWKTDRSGFFTDIDTAERYRSMTGEEPCEIL